MDSKKCIGVSPRTVSRYDFQELIQECVSSFLARIMINGWVTPSPARTLYGQLIDRDRDVAKIFESAVWDLNAGNFVL